MPLSIEDKFAIAELSNRMGFAIDDRDADAWVACFTPDGVFETPEKKFAGSEELRQLVASLPVTPRIQRPMSNLQIEGDGDRATARANGLVFEDDGDLHVGGMARHEYTYKRIDGKWLIERTARIRPSKDV